MEFWIGAGLACLGIAVGIGQWVIPPQKLACGIRNSLIGFACVSCLIGIVLIGYAIPPHKPEQSNAKPHILMTPFLGIEGSETVVRVIFDNRGQEDVEGVTLRILLNDGQKFNESTREVPILREL